MSQPYFVRDHRRAVANFIAALPFEQAMARSVGPKNLADLDQIAQIELSIIEEFGLADGCRLIDIGCGCGGLSAQLSPRFGDSITYLGTDVVPDLLAFARGRASKSYHFELVADCTIPAPDATADFVTLFSVFTHLRRRDIARYMTEAHRVLRPGGKLIFSYLELPRHAKIFAYTVAVTVLRRRKVENHFTSERIIKRWATESGFVVDAIMPGRIGQSVAVLLKS
jgi:ubiquinone/menaquinone biosynthesis C-methylase UbiE